MKQVAEIVRREQAIDHGTVGHVGHDGLTGTELRLAAASGDLDRHRGKVLAMLTGQIHRRCIDGLLSATRARSVRPHGSGMDDNPRLTRDDVQPCGHVERTIIAQGELLTSAIFTHYLHETGSDAVCLYSPGLHGYGCGHERSTRQRYWHGRLSASTADDRNILRRAGISSARIIAARSTTSDAAAAITVPP
ncbi:MAG: hypothetical protein ACLTZY_11365 [Alistipes indistinctus]